MTMINKLICRMFGHNINSAQWLMFKIEIKAMRVGSNIRPQVTCNRCSEVFYKKGTLR